MRRIIIIPAVALLLFCAAQVFGNHESHVNWGDLIWRTLNFICFVGVIWWAAGDKLAGLLRGRRDTIAQDFDHLEHSRKEAEQKLKDLAARIAHMDAERDAILAESKAQAEAVKAQIITQATLQAEEILTQSRRAAESEAKRMADALRARVADDVVAAVQKNLAGRLDAAEHDRLIDNALKKVVVQ